MKGNLVYLYAALRALAGWKPAHFTVTVDGERHEVTGYSVAVGNSKAYGGGMYVAPHAELDDGLLDVMLVEEHVEAATSCATLPKVFKGTHVDSPYVEFLARRGDRGGRRPPVHHLRRRRPDRRARPRRSRVEPRCLRVIVPRG